MCSITHQTGCTFLKNCADVIPGPLLQVYSIDYRNKRLVNNLCTSLNSLIVKKFIIIIIIIHIKLIFLYLYISIFVTAITCSHNKSNSSLFAKSICFSQNDRLNTKLHVEFKNNILGLDRSTTLRVASNSCKRIKLCLD